MSETKDTTLAAMQNLSPRRNTTEAENVDQLVAEQLVHFGINPATDHGRALASIAHRLYQAGGDAEALWRLTQQSIGSLDRSDRIAYFNAKKFLSFQTAKLLDMLQTPFRCSYQALKLNYSTQSAKGPYRSEEHTSELQSH